jgi:hypothetical protein
VAGGAEPDLGHLVGHDDRGTVDKDRRVHDPAVGSVQPGKELGVEGGLVEVQRGGSVMDGDEGRSAPVVRRNVRVCSMWRKLTGRGERRLERMRPRT